MNIADQIIMSFKTEPSKWSATEYRVFNHDFLNSGKTVSIWIANGVAFIRPETIHEKDNAWQGGRPSWWCRYRIHRAYKKWSKRPIDLDEDPIEAEIRRILDE